MVNVIYLRGDIPTLLHIMTYSNPKKDGKVTYIDLQLFELNFTFLYVWGVLHTSTKKKKSGFQPGAISTVAPDHHPSPCPPRTAAGWQSPANLGPLGSLPSGNLT